MQPYTLKCDGDRSLAFDGVIIGEGSSRRVDASRWFEVKIFRTAGNQYVVGGAGRTILPGERDRCWAVTAQNGQEVIKSLTRVDEDGIEYLTSTARDALEQASEKDSEIRSAFLKRVA